MLGLPPQLVVQVLRKAASAVGDILSNPVGFLLNLLGAVRAGFSRFFGNILTHLLGGIGGWLLSQVRDAGLTPPADFSLRSILGFVLDVLGVTVERIFERLSQRLGPAVVARLRTMLGVATGVWRFITILVEQGPAGLWEELQSQLSNLWDTVLGGVIGWVNERIIDRAMRWLMSLLDVTGVMPVINTLVAVYNAIESFVQYLRQMLEIVSTVLDGVLGIARGAIDAAAGFLEGALSRSLPVAIGFLANQFGLGRLGAAHRRDPGHRARHGGPCARLADRPRHPPGPKPDRHGAARRGGGGQRGAQLPRAAGARARRRWTGAHDRLPGRGTQCADGAALGAAAA